MADLILPARFNSQPQYRAVVDAGNPITRGLVYAYNPAAGLIDLAGNQANNGFTGTYSLSGMPPNERGIYFDGASYFKVTRNAGYVATSSSPHTMLALCRPTGAGKYMVPVALGEVTDSNYTSAIQIDTASGWLAHKIDSPAAVSSLTTPADTNLCLAVAVRGAADRTFAKNGQLQVNTTSIGGGATAGGMVIGNHFRNSSPEAVQYFVGWIGLVLVWNRALTDAELHSITVNPWQIFKAPTQRLWPRDSAATGITGTSTTTLDAVTTSAAATLQLKAAAGITLDSITPAAASKLYLAANSSAQLADLATSATGAVQIKGASSITLGDVTAAAAALQIKAAASITLASVTAGGAGVLPLAGTGGGQLDSIGTAATGALQIKANASITLDGITATATGSAIDSNTGTSSITLDSITPAAASKLYLASTSSVQLDGISTSSAATLRLVASGGITLGNVSTSAAGAEAVIPAVIFGPRPGGAQTQTTLRSGNATRTRASASGGRRR